MSNLNFAKLGDVAEFVRGVTFSSDDVLDTAVPGSVACFRTKNIQESLDLDDVWSIDGGLVKRSEQFMVAGDILVSTANSWNLVGKCVWVPVLENRSCFGGFVSVLRGREEKIRRKYLYWWFSSPRVQRVLQSFGNKTTSISNLNIERCLSLEVPLPDLAEQDRVVELLDRVDALLRLRKKNHKRAIADEGSTSARIAQRVE